MYWRDGNTIDRFTAAKGLPWPSKLRSELCFRSIALDKCRQLPIHRRSGGFTVPARNVTQRKAQCQSYAIDNINRTLDY